MAVTSSRAAAVAAGAFMRPAHDSARLIASEFATNAVRHAGTPFTFVVPRRGRLLHLAVRDQDPRLPPVHEGSTPVFDPLAEHGRGLLLVAAHATAWGRCGAGSGRWCGPRCPARRPVIHDH
jgi:anti-sigma regulatory factor (Ser/Thr protein kinase)